MDTSHEQKQSFWVRCKSFLLKCKRVWQVTKKPSMEEYKVIMKVTGIGILLIGAVGFLITFLWAVTLQ